MQKFAALLDQLYFTYSNNEKSELLQKYFLETTDPERGLVLGVIAGTLNFPIFKRTLIKELITQYVDPVLVDMSYDYVGDLSETISLLWPENSNETEQELPEFSEIINSCQQLTKTELKNYLADLLSRCTSNERWALLKLGTGGLRIGVSARFIKQVLAVYGKQDIQSIEQIWHGVKPPYLELFAWLEHKTAKPNISDSIFFHPVMLSHPLGDEELDKLKPEDFAVEKKFDGIRVQIIVTPQNKALYSRAGDDISESFPDVLAPLSSHVILDGELVIKKSGLISSFNDLQQRLGRKAPTKKLMQELPGFVILYDILQVDDKDLRNLSFEERRVELEKWFSGNTPPHMLLSPLFEFASHAQLIELRNTIIEENDISVEGLMLKRKNSPYVAGRPTGLWYKWKRDPFVVDAILMYAQRGHGKRSSYYSDYTFGLWEDDQLLPIGKAYSGFTDSELLELDKWIRHNTIGRFGPVREVKKQLVLEIAFDAISYSTRHKSGIALRFPRVNRIRWDKPAAEVDSLAYLKKLLK